MNIKLLCALAVSPVLSVAAVNVAQACTTYGLIGEKWHQNPSIGACVDDEHNDGKGGRVQTFQYGTIDWDGHSAHAYSLIGDINAKWKALGMAPGWGHPVMDETPSGDGVGRYNWFDSGNLIIWSPSSRAHGIYGDILKRWESLGSEYGSLGYPTSDEVGISGGRMQAFQNGYIDWFTGRETIAQIGGTEMIYQIPGIGFGGGDPVGTGQPITLSLYSNGQYAFSGGFHNGATVFNPVPETASIIVAVKTASGTVLTFSHSGSVSAYSRDDNWNNTGTNPALASAWKDLQSGANFKWDASTKIDVDGLWTEVQAVIGVVTKVIAVVGAL